MASNNGSYEKIASKIKAMKADFPGLRNKSDEYVFSALCVKAHLYKNPAFVLDEDDFDEIIVDGTGDGGVDILLTDPSSDSSDLVIAQSKYYTKITSEDVLNAMTKMAFFYKEMSQGKYNQVNEKVQRRFLTLNSEQGEDSKTRFIFYTSAPQSHIRKDNIERKLLEFLPDSSNIEISIFFAKDIEDEIDESESRRLSVERGKITIDRSGNYLTYEENAVIVNVSAFSIKELYARYNVQLLAKNLRYHISGARIDHGIRDTINNKPDSFWFKNNGITIVCDDFQIDGREVKMQNFSIINGGQTTYMLHRSSNIDADHDLYLPCKIIRIEGNSEDERNAFSLAIAKAVNTQKPIKEIDLRANAPEQLRFSQAMRDVGVFYQTKRGEKVPKIYSAKYANTDLLEVGKLCLAAVFQMPCVSRTKPSTLYQPQYYNRIFNGNQQQIAMISRELLYIDNFFRDSFIKKFDKDNENQPDSTMRISLAHNARTICVAFTALASRFHQGNITNQDLREVFSASKSSYDSDNRLYEIFSDLDGVCSLFPTDVFEQKDKLDAILDRLFLAIIDAGAVSYSMASNYDASLNATNYLKKDKNYYSILALHWSSTLQKKIEDAMAFGR